MLHTGTRQDTHCVPTVLLKKESLFITVQGHWPAKCLAIVIYMCHLCRKCFVSVEYRTGSYQSHCSHIKSALTDGTMCQQRLHLTPPATRKTACTDRPSSLRGTSNTSEPAVCARLVRSGACGAEKIVTPDTINSSVNFSCAIELSAVITSSSEDDEWLDELAPPLPATTSSTCASKVLPMALLLRAASKAAVTCARTCSKI
eukprot:COSAG01_NODE_200_length_22187_cov_59.140529_13_plen_202_part_00